MLTKIQPFLFLAALSLAGPAATQTQTPSPASGGQNPLASAARTVLQGICMPLARGDSIDAVARESGLRMKDGQWTLPIGGAREVTIVPPDVSNPHLCMATFTYNAGQGATLVNTVSQWAAAQIPSLAPVKVQSSERGPAMLRTTSSWEGAGPKETDAVVL
jgi:hypothetical protein